MTMTAREALTRAAEICRFEAEASEWRDSQSARAAEVVILALRDSLPEDQPESAAQAVNGTAGAVSGPDTALPVAADHARRLASAIVRDVAELPDRTSPDDAPEMMTVTSEELHDIAVRWLNDDIARWLNDDHPESAPSQAPAQPDAGATKPSAFYAEAEPCRGCGKPLLRENAGMWDGCPCNTDAGVNDGNLYRWRLLSQLQQAQQHDLFALRKQIARRLDASHDECLQREESAVQSAFMFAAREEQAVQRAQIAEAQLAKMRAQQNIQDRPAVESAVKVLIQRFEKAPCDSDGVAQCVHCNVMFLARVMRDMLDASQPPAEQSEKEGKPLPHAQPLLMALAKEELFPS